MIEIALCLGIIAFALVAIIGVLPTGVNVQKENREETIINQDGLFLLEAIRSGAKGLDSLTNNVETIRVGSLTYTNPRFPDSLAQSPRAGSVLTNGMQIVGLLSSPYRRFFVNHTTGGSGVSVESSGVVKNGSFTVTVSAGTSDVKRNALEGYNPIEARIRSITGVASDQRKVVSDAAQDLAFRYQARVEIEPLVRPPLYWASVDQTVLPMPGILASDRATSRAMLNNLYEVRLTLRWPVYPQGNNWQTGRHRRTFRTLVSGELIRTNSTGAATTPFLYFFEPNSSAAITNVVTVGGL